MRGNRIAGVDRSISLNHDGSFASGRRCLRRDCKDFELRFDQRLSVAAHRRAVRAGLLPGFPTGGHILELVEPYSFLLQAKVVTSRGLSSATKG